MPLLATLEGRPARDYSVSGPEADRAAKRGLADGEWFRSPIEPERLRQLSERSNRRAITDVAIWLVLLVVLGAAAVAALGSWWTVPLFFLYGGVYGGSADARWHEFGHGTATSARRFNDAVYVFASFLLWRSPTAWRWSHFRHHSDTIIVGRDPEIQIGRPGKVRKLVLNFIYVPNGLRALAQLLRYATGRLDADTLDFTPVDERRRIVTESRWFIGILVCVAGTAVATTSWIPLLLVGLPTIYGAWMMVLFGSTQHLGLSEDVLDHRMSTRTVLMNPVSRFLYLNMNFHLEHHMFPMVPYYRLPELHAEIKDTLPPPSPSMWHAYREIVSALWKQRLDPGYVVPNRIVPVVETRSKGRVGAVRPDGRFDLGSEDCFSIATVTRVDVDNRTFAVARTTDGTVCVVDGICTHGNAHLAEGAVIGGQLECPKHAGRFDLLTGAPCSKPAKIPLAVHPVEILGGHLITQESLS